MVRVTCSVRASLQRHCSHPLSFETLTISISCNVVPALKVVKQMEDPGGAGGISPAWLQDDDSLPLHSFVESLLAAPEHEFIDPAGGAVGIGAADAQSSDKTQALARLLAAASDYAANLQFDPSTSDGMQLPQLTSLLGHHTVMQLPTSLHHTHVLGSLPSDPCLAGFGGNTPLQQLVLTFHNVLDNKKEFCRPQQPTNWRLIDNTFVTLRCDYTSRGVGGPRSWPRPTPIGEEGLALIQLAHKRCIYRLSRATPSAQLPAHQGCLGGAVMSQQQQQQSTAGTAAEASPLLEVDMEVCWTFVARRPVVSTPALAASGRLTAAAAAAAEARRAGGGSGALTPATSPATRYWRPHKTRDPAGDKHDACWVVGCVAALEFTGVELARRPPSLGTLPSLLPRVTPQTLPQQQQQQLGPLLLRECGAIHGLATVSCGHSQQNTYQQENAAAAAATAGPSLGIWPEEHVQARQGELPHPSQAQNASLIQAAAPPTTITQGVMVVTALAEQGCLFALVPPEIRAQVESAAAEGAATAEEEEEEEEEGAAAAAAAACGAEEEPSTEAFSGSDRKVASPPPWELCEALVQQQLRAAAGQQHGARSSATSHHGCRVPRHLLHRAEDVAAAVSHGLLEAAAGLPGPNTCTALEQQLVRLDAHMREVTQLLGQAQEGPPAPALVVTLQRVREPWFLGRSLLHLLASSVAVWGPAATHTPQGQMGPAVRSASLRKLWAGAEARGGAAALLDAVNRNDATPWLTACHFALPEVLEFLLSCQELTLRRMLVPSKRGMVRWCDH
jgi:hypothetical protein